MQQSGLTEVIQNATRQSGKTRLHVFCHFTPFPQARGYLLTLEPDLPVTETAIQINAT